MVRPAEHNDFLRLTCMVFYISLVKMKENKYSKTGKKITATNYLPILKLN